MRKLIVRTTVVIASLLAAFIFAPATALAVSFPVTVDETSFPDSSFRQIVLDEIAGPDGILTQSEAEAVIDLNLANEGISSLIGIEYFTMATSLSCYYNDLVELDVTGMTSLRDLYCYENSLTSLTVTGLTSLRSVDCSHNFLTALDLSNLANFTDLSCNNNLLTSLDVSDLPQLETLFCYENYLAVLDVSSATSLRSLQCSDNPLVSLNVTNLGNLQYLFSNNCNLATIDLTGLTALIVLGCSNNAITSLDFTDSTGVISIVCSDNSLTSLDLSTLVFLSNLDCSFNSLPSLDVSNLGFLQTLYCNDNILTSLMLPEDVSISELYVFNNSLLDISGRLPTALLDGQGQTRTVRMIPDPLGGFMSESVYVFLAGHSIGGFDMGIALEGDDRFHAESLPTTSPFVTSLGAPQRQLSGELTFEIVTHTVTFLDWDGSLLGIVNVDFGATVVPPSNPAREGYTFVGWSADLANITADTTVTALYEAAPIPLPSPPNSSSGSLVNTEDSLPLLAVLVVSLIAFGALAAAARVRISHKKEPW